VESVAVGAGGAGAAHLDGFPVDAGTCTGLMRFALGRCRPALFDLLAFRALGRRWSPGSGATWPTRGAERGRILWPRGKPFAVRRHGVLAGMGLAVERPARRKPLDVLMAGRARELEAARAWGPVGPQFLGAGCGNPRTRRLVPRALEASAGTRRLSRLPRAVTPSRPSMPCIRDNRRWWGGAQAAARGTGTGRWEHAS